MNKEDFEARLIAMQDSLWHISSTILYRPQDREDAIQECVFKALRKREHLRDDQAFQ